jgi:hypothetical protein
MHETSGHLFHTVEDRHRAWLMVLAVRNEFATGYKHGGHVEDHGCDSELDHVFTVYGDVSRRCQPQSLAAIFALNLNSDTNSPAYSVNKADITLPVGGLIGRLPVFLNTFDFNHILAVSLNSSNSKGRIIGGLHIVENWISTMIVATTIRPSRPRPRPHLHPHPHQPPPLH